MNSSWVYTQILEFSLSDPAVQASTSRRENCLDFFKSGRDGLSVTDLVNQYWCEQQFEYTFSAPILKPVPAIVSAGSSIHLERGTLIFFDLILNY